MLKYYRYSLNIRLLIPFIIFLLMNGWSYAFADNIEPLRLTGEIGEYSTAGHITYFEDETRELSIKDIDNPLVLDRFKKSDNSIPHFGVTTSAYWFHIQVINSDTMLGDWWLELQDPVTDYVDVYIKNNEGELEHIALGDNRPFSNRKVKVRNPVAVVSLQPNKLVDIFVRIQTNGTLSAPLYLWTPEAYPTRAINAQMEYGLYYGIILALFLYNLMLFVSIRDYSYLYYCSFIFFYAVWQFCYNGLAYEYLWPNNGQFNLTAALTASNFYCLSMLLFVRSFLNIPKSFPRINKVIILWAVLGLIPLTAFYFFSKSFAVRINAIFALSAASLIFSTSLYAAYKGVKEARYLLLAWTAFIAGVATFNLMLVGILPANYITIHGQQIGSAIEAVLLSFALAYRMRLLMQENERIQMEAKQTLENRVIERTKELDIAMSKLEAANLSLQEKSFNDGLTGVKNRMYLEEHYKKEWLRCRREEQYLALLMIDLDHFKRINDEYGHLCGDQVLCFAADIIKQTICRASDTIARYGGEEFLVILPNTDHHGAYTIAENIRKRLETSTFEFNGKAINITASIGYAVERVKQDAVDEHSLIDAADQALYSAKNNGRNKVMLFAA